MEKNYRNEEEKFKNFITKQIIEIIQKINPNYFVSKLSNFDDDTKYSFDINFGNIKISVRLRKNYYIKYDDITIRSKVNGNGKTEIDKLINGEGQIYFYGWLDKTEQQIDRYVIFDIDKIRDKLKNNGSFFRNSDGTEFKTYTIDFLKENDAILANKYRKTI